MSVGHSAPEPRCLRFGRQCLAENVTLDFPAKKVLDHVFERVDSPKPRFNVLDAEHVGIFAWIDRNQHNRPPSTDPRFRCLAGLFLGGRIVRGIVPYLDSERRSLQVFEHVGQAFLHPVPRPVDSVPDPDTMDRARTLKVLEGAIFHHVLMHGAQLTLPIIEPVNEPILCCLDLAAIDSKRMRGIGLHRHA